MVRQGLLAEATKNFISWSNMQYVPLAQTVQDLLEQLSESTAEVSKHFTHLTAVTLHLDGAGDKQIKEMQVALRFPRYRKLAEVHREITKYLETVAEEEQPFRRV